MKSLRRALVALALAATFPLAAVPTASAATPVPTPDASGYVAGLPDPGPKAHSPQTDLAHHPKGSLNHQAPPAITTSGVEQDTVISERANPDGSVTATVYDLAPGFTAAQVAAQLKAQSVQARTVKPAASPASPARAAVNPNACSYGVARATSQVPCPVPGHYNNNGFSDPQVRINDHSSAAWPTDAAVYDWNTAVGIDTYYLYNSCPFKAGARCVDVYSGNYGANGVYAQTTLTAYGSDHSFSDSGRQVQLNDYYSNSLGAAGHREIVAHELGHVLGLGHSPSSSDVMWGGTNRTGQTRGSADDFGFLANLYSIAR